MPVPVPPGMRLPDSQVLLQPVHFEGDLVRVTKQFAEQQEVQGTPRPDATSLSFVAFERF